MGHEQLIDVAFTNPTVCVQGSYRDTGLSAEYSFRPLTNLVFSRDQQITTARGIVMASLRSKQRATEGRLMRFCLDKLGLPVIGGVEPPGFLEGGDFFPAGEDLCFIGVGLRSNMEACEQLMERDLLGTRRVAVVLDRFDQSQDRMHLDCVFSIVHDDCVLLLEDIIGPGAPGRRLVAEFVRGENGQYRPVDGPEVEFSEFLQRNGYNIIKVSPQQQLESVSVEVLLKQKARLQAELDKLERWRASVGSSFQVAWQEERAAHQRDLNEMTRELGAAQDRARRLQLELEQERSGRAAQHLAAKHAIARAQADTLAARKSREALKRNGGEQLKALQRH